MNCQRRIIPARAGPTHGRWKAPSATTDHPRSCGANIGSCVNNIIGFGSSPLVRGQRHARQRRVHRQRIIPARAGPTSESFALPFLVPDHPRSCGANVTIKIRSRHSDGSSPLVRGQPFAFGIVRGDARIIPARAGPTRWFKPSRRRRPDHPRSCGANHVVIGFHDVLCGSSPLVRGQR